MYRELFKYANETGPNPDYISYAYITIALMIGAFVAVKLYRGAKNRAKSLIYNTFFGQKVEMLKNEN